MPDDIGEWLDAHSEGGFLWYVKRLSGNDTLANKSNQAGPYIPREIAFRVYPDLARQEIKNPDINLELQVDSHGDHRRARVVWYNNRFHGKGAGGRNETRLTNLGGGASALLDPESTGALTVFAFRIVEPPQIADCHAWVCRQEIEEELVEERTGPVEPGNWAVWPPVQASLFAARRPAGVGSCRLDPADIPADWLRQFPSGEEIIRLAMQRRPGHNLQPDRRLLQRRKCEFDIFRSVEEAVELPAILAGFSSIDGFVARAQTILQRRKARSGRSLELHTREILLEERLLEGMHFSHQPESEPGKRPDFLFPSEAAYRDRGFPAERLRMLAVKTTCRDRWRQILNEANRIPRKHLLTLQDGVSEAQFAEMAGADVQLVVPAELTARFPKSVQPNLQTLEDFIAEIRLIST